MQFLICQPIHIDAVSDSSHIPHMNENWFRENLKRVGATQEDLAKAIGRDRAVVSRVIRGRQALNLEWAEPFARVLQVPVSAVLRQAGLALEPAPTRRIIVGISGATGVEYGVRLLTLLKQLEIESHLVMSRAAEIAMTQETDYKPREIATQADKYYHINDVAAAIASGSFKTMGMIIAPCSIRSMSEIASGATSNLLTRAADVVLKERRRLVLMVRESPLHGGHLRNMARLSDLGAIIAPPMPAFYPRPKSLEEMVDHGLGRVLDLFDLETAGLQRWGEDIGLR